jgi:hypothetical protein
LFEANEVVLPEPSDELFGPFANSFLRFKPTRMFVLWVAQETKGGVGAFFLEARRALLEVTAGLQGFGLDVLRLWPFPLMEAAEALPEDPLAEDLFSVGFSDRAQHGFRAETIGLSKLGQREISFEFRGRELLEEAALLCGHLADWALEQGQRVEGGQSMAYGFDRLSFFAPEGAAAPELRAWHSPLMLRIVPPELFPGVGVLEVLMATDGDDPEQHDLTSVLSRALEQRLVLEDYDLTGDAPYRSATATVSGSIVALKSVTAVREEPVASKDSGWRFVSRLANDEAPQGEVVSLAEFCERAPALIRYLALPPGARLDWDFDGQLTVDVSRARTAIDDDVTDGNLDD